MMTRFPRLHVQIRSMNTDFSPGLMPGSGVDEAARHDQRQNEPIDVVDRGEHHSRFSAFSGSSTFPAGSASGLADSSSASRSAGPWSRRRGEDIQESRDRRIDGADLDVLAEPGVEAVDHILGRLGHEAPEDRTKSEVVQRPLDQARQGRQADEELTDVVQAELLGVGQRVDPTAGRRSSFAHHQPDEEKPEDADRVDSLARPALVEVAKSRTEPCQKGRLSRIMEIDLSLRHNLRISKDYEEADQKAR